MKEGRKPEYPETQGTQRRSDTHNLTDASSQITYLHLRPVRRVRHLSFGHDVAVVGAGVGGMTSVHPHGAHAATAHAAFGRHWARGHGHGAVVPGGTHTRLVLWGAAIGHVTRTHHLNINVEV